MTGIERQLLDALRELHDLVVEREQGNSDLTEELDTAQAAIDAAEESALTTCSVDLAVCWADGTYTIEEIIIDLPDDVPGIVVLEIASRVWARNNPEQSAITIGLYRWGKLE